MSSRRRKRRVYSSGKRSSNQRQEPIQTTATECCFCKEKDDITYGAFFSDPVTNVAAHQFCLLFSAGLAQQGEDDEGFEGFLLADVKKEAVRASKINCKYCQLPGASSGCCVKSCRSTFHYKCGLKEDIQFVFSGSFDTYCNVHRKKQDLSYISLPSHLKSPASLVSCPLCMEDIVVADRGILKMPCCRNKFAHKECVQRQAASSGYFFKCPTCNNEELFQEEMARFGIYIPQRDAAWEENDAFSELLEEYAKCDWPQCKCSKGRTFSDDDKWEVLRCYHCGQSGVHRKCLGQFIIPVFDYICPDCNDVVREVTTPVAIMPDRMDERQKEHKRRLAELTARCDPVLLASSVLSSPIWKKHYNLKDCYVLMDRIPENVMGNLKYGRKILLRKYYELTYKNRISMKRNQAILPVDEMKDTISFTNNENENRVYNPQGSTLFSANPTNLATVHKEHMSNSVTAIVPNMVVPKEEISTKISSPSPSKTMSMSKTASRIMACITPNQSELLKKSPLNISYGYKKRSYSGDESNSEYMSTDVKRLKFHESYNTVVLRGVHSIYPMNSASSIVDNETSESSLKQVNSDLDRKKLLIKFPFGALKKKPFVLDDQNLHRENTSDVSLMSSNAYENKKQLGIRHNVEHTKQLRIQCNEENTKFASCLTSSSKISHKAAILQKLTGNNQNSTEMAELIDNNNIEKKGKLKLFDSKIRKNYSSIKKIKPSRNTLIDDWLKKKVVKESKTVVTNIVTNSMKETENCSLAPIPEVAVPVQALEDDKGLINPIPPTPVRATKKSYKLRCQLPVGIMDTLPLGLDNTDA